MRRAPRDCEDLVGRLRTLTNVLGLVAAGCSLPMVLAVGAAFVPAEAEPEPPHADHPPPGFTGGFGEETCHSCHFDNDLNAADGRLEIEGLPPAYRPDTVYFVTVRLEREQLPRAGFMLSARFASGKQAGMLHSTDEYTAVSVVDSTGVAYAHHTLPGTAVTEGSLARWTLRWMAPRDAAPADTVYFDVVANASNDDESAFGDRIYARAIRLKPSPK